MSQQMSSVLSTGDQTPVILNGIDEDLHIITLDGQVVVSSRYVSEVFNKEHKHVLDSIREIIKGVDENSADLFIESNYQHPQNKQWYPEYMITRDGFTLLAMGFTGKEALQWKLKYIEAFNKMENYIREKQKPMCLEDLIIMQAQALKDAREEAKKATTVAIEAKNVADQAVEKVEAIKEVIILNTTSWREDTTNLINKIATYRGGTHNIYQETRREAYELLDKRFGVNLEQRLRNKRLRMADEGISKSKRDKVSKLDVIAEDKKLIEGYVIVIKDMALRYGVGAND